NADSQDALGFGFNDQFREPFRTADRLGPPRGAPREADDDHFAILGFGLGFGQAAPGDLGIGKDNRRYRRIVERGRFAGERFGDNLGFARRLVGQHRLARDVTDGEYIRVGGAPLRIDGHEPFGVNLDLGIFQSQVLAVGTAADRDQYPVEYFFDNFAFFGN